MPFKIDSPLFADTATGPVRALGSFRRTVAGTYLVTGLRGNPTPTPETAIIRACFASAKTAHSAISPVWVKILGRWRLRRYPSWPVFWSNWLTSHPECLL